MKPLEARIADAVALADPIARFRELSELEDGPRDLASRIRSERARVVLELRGSGPGRGSWSEVGALLGISGERARQLAEEAPTERIEA